MIPFVRQIKEFTIESNYMVSDGSSRISITSASWHHPINPSPYPFQKDPLMFTNV